MSKPFPIRLLSYWVYYQVLSVITRCFRSDRLLGLKPRSVRLKPNLCVTTLSIRLLSYWVYYQVLNLITRCIVSDRLLGFKLKSVRLKPKLLTR